MRILKRLIALTMVFALISSSFSALHAFADSSANTVDDKYAIECTAEFMRLTQYEDNAWRENGRDYTSVITDILEYVYEDTYTFSDDTYDKLGTMIEKSMDHIWERGIKNVEMLSGYVLIEELRSSHEIDSLLSFQNPDGGFGLAENYASDIIDTKLALKALADLDETEAMTNAAVYIASLQNTDGGFSYQQGLDSNSELTAEIADIFGDCIIKDQSLAYTLSDTLSNLNYYLDDNMPALEYLSENNLSEVYQNFHTVLFSLKTTYP